MFSAKLYTIVKILFAKWRVKECLDALIGIVRWRRFQSASENKIKVNKNRGRFNWSYSLINVKYWETMS